MLKVLNVVWVEYPIVEVVVAMVVDTAAAVVWQLENNEQEKNMDHQLEQNTKFELKIYHHVLVGRI